MEFVKKHLPVVRILVQEIPFHSELRGRYRSIVETSLLPKIEDITKRYQAHGLVRDDIPPISVIRFTITSILGFIFARFILLPDLQWDDELEVERTIDFIMHGLAGTSTTQPAGGPTVGAI